MLEFKITEQNTIRVDNSKVVADFTKFIEFKLELPENWQGLTVNGLFYREEDETLGMVENIVSGEVRNLPSAPFKGEEFGQDFKVFISFVGTGSDGKTATSSVYELTVQPSGLSGMNVTPEGDEENPFARFLRLVEEERKKAEAAAKTAAADAIEQLQPSIDEIIAAAGSASESAKSAARSENAAAGSEQSAARDAAKAAQDRAAADQAVIDAEAAKQTARESAIAAAASQAAAAESEKKTEVDAAKTGQDRAAAEQAASDAAAAKETAIQKAEAAEQSRLKAAESEQIATGAAEQSNVQAAAAERSAEAAQAAKKTAEEKASAATQSEQAAANSAAVCVEAGEKVSRAEAAAVRAEQAADSIQEAVDANNAAQAAKTETISAKNATIAASQTAQLEAQKVKQIVAGNEAYTKTESDLKYTVAPRKEASSDTGELKLTDADEGLSYLALQGNSGQYTATGTNLFDVKQLVKNMQALNSKYITIGKDGDGEFMNILNNAWNRLRCLEFTNDPAKSYRIGCKARYSSGNGNIILFSVMYKDGTYTSSNRILNQTEYTEMFAIIPAGKEVDYFYFSYSNGGSYYDVLLDSFYLYPEDAPSTEKPTGGYGTPSPEYPSEVRSVGDIPKDINGVEIRNLLDESLTIGSEVVSGWQVLEGFEIPAGTYQIKTEVCGKAFTETINMALLSIDKQLGQVFILIGSSGAPASGTFTIQSESKGYFFIRQPLTMKEISDNYHIMITEAAEIDEYRPYIGENNGLVKLESIGVNHADTGDGPVYIAGVNRIEVNTWTPRKIVLTQKNKDTSYAYLKLNVERGKDYTFYCKVKVEVIDGAATDGVTSIGFRQYPPGGAMYGQTMLSQDGQYKDIYNTVGVIPDDVPNIAFMLYLNSSSASNGNIKMTIDDLMVVEGTKTLQEMQALKFQPYYQQITWIPLKEPLRKIANSGRYLDSLDKDGNVTQMIVKKILNKSGVGYNGEALGGAGVQGVISLGTSNVKFDVETQYSNQALSNVFKTSYGNIMNYQVLYRSSVGANVSVAFIVDKNILSSNNKEGLLNYLMTLPDIAEYFVLDTPVTYQIPAVYIETHDPETNVRCLNKVKPSDMTLDYKIAMSSLIKRLEALEEKTVQEV